MRSEPVNRAKRDDDQLTSRPWVATLDMRSGALWPPSDIVTCRLSDMHGRYADTAAEEALVAFEDPLIYRADEILAPELHGELHTSVTVVFPGKVGNEYFMSKGHYHVEANCVKVYLAVSGHGFLLMQNEAGETMEAEMTPGSIVYCAPGWAQRTVNVGAEPFAYYKYWPAESGHDYDRILETGGFRKRIIEQNGRPVIVDSATS